MAGIKQAGQKHTIVVNLDPPHFSHTAPLDIIKFIQYQLINKKCCISFPLGNQLAQNNKSMYNQKITPVVVEMRHSHNLVKDNVELFITYLNLIHFISLTILSSHGLYPRRGPTLPLFYFGQCQTKVYANLRTMSNTESTAFQGDKIE